MRTNPTTKTPASGWTNSPEFAKLLIISEKAVDAGIAAIKAGAKIVTDVKMVKAGINEARLKKFSAKILTYIDDKRAIKLANDESITRAAAAMRLAVKDGLDGAIVVIGNAPTAAFELADAVKQGLAKPALIIAVPVGYVGAAESKEAISKLPIPFVIVGTTFFWRHIYPRYYRVWDSQSKTAQLLSGLLSGIRLVKAFGQEQREQRRFSGAAEYLQGSRRSLETSVATFNPIMGFIFGLGGLIIWYAGGNLVLKDRLSLGTLMAFFGYLGMFYGPISSLSMFSNWVTGFVSAGQRVFEVLDAQVAVREVARPVRLPHLRGRIEFRNVTFGYDPYNPVLKNVSFTVEPGQFVGIVGKSGSGKTTLVNLLCRFYDPQEGQVLVDGVDLRELSQEDLRRHMALVLQEPFLFRATIAENIAYGRPDAEPLAILNAARAANAHDFIARRPAAYDTRLGEHGAGLSGGERQRISIARALLCDPRDRKSVV